jgi:hypothetical protein
MVLKCFIIKAVITMKTIKETMIVSETIKKSIFTCHLFPIESQNDAKKKLERLNWRILMQLITVMPTSLVRTRRFISMMMTTNRIKQRCCHL